jgi:hypothetical protein
MTYEKKKKQGGWVWAVTYLARAFGIYRYRGTKEEARVRGTSGWVSANNKNADKPAFSISVANRDSSSQILSSVNCYKSRRLARCGDFVVVVYIHPSVPALKVPVSTLVRLFKMVFPEVPQGRYVLCVLPPRFWFKINCDALSAKLVYDGENEN